MSLPHQDGPGFPLVQLQVSRAQGHGECPAVIGKPAWVARAPGAVGGKTLLSACTNPRIGVDCPNEVVPASSVPAATWSFAMDRTHLPTPSDSSHQPGHSGQPAGENKHPVKVRLTDECREQMRKRWREPEREAIKDRLRVMADTAEVLESDPDAPMKVVELFDASFYFFDSRLKLNSITIVKIDFSKEPVGPAQVSLRSEIRKASIAGAVGAILRAIWDKIPHSSAEDFEKYWRERPDAHAFVAAQTSKWQAESAPETDADLTFGELGGDSAIADPPAVRLGITGSQAPPGKDADLAESNVSEKAYEVEIRKRGTGRNHTTLVFIGATERATQADSSIPLGMYRVADNSILTCFSIGTMMARATSIADAAPRGSREPHAWTDTLRTLPAITGEYMSASFFSSSSGPDTSSSVGWTPGPTPAKKAAPVPAQGRIPDSTAIANVTTADTSAATPLAPASSTSDNVVGNVGTGATAQIELPGAALAKKAAPAAVTADGVDVGLLRTSLGMTQDQFADTFALSVSTLRNWEQGLRKPDGAATTYLTLIAHFPQQVMEEVAVIRRKE